MKKKSDTVEIGL